jgi:hypothetical protein
VSTLALCFIKVLNHLVNVKLSENIHSYSSLKVDFRFDVCRFIRYHNHLTRLGQKLLLSAITPVSLEFLTLIDGLLDLVDANVNDMEQDVARKQRASVPANQELIRPADVISLKGLDVRDKEDGDHFIEHLLDVLHFVK